MHQCDAATGTLVALRRASLRGIRLHYIPAARDVAKRDRYERPIHLKLALFLLVLAAFAALVVWLVRKNRQLLDARDAQFAAGARLQGWSYAPNPGYSAIISRGPGALQRTEDEDIAYSFEGELAGATWRMWYDTQRRFATRPGDSSSTTSVAVWAGESVRANALALLILPRLQYRLESSRIVGAVASAANSLIAAVSGGDPRESRQEFLRNSTEVQGSIPGFREFIVVLTGPGVLADWLDAELQSMLLHWPPGTAPAKPTLTVSLGSGGLRIEVLRPIDGRWEFWEHLGRLGAELTSRLTKRGTATAPKS